MPTIHARVRGQRVRVLCPESVGDGPLSVELLATLNRARAEGAGVCLLGHNEPDRLPLLSLRTDDLPLRRASGVSSAWLRARCWGNSYAGRTAECTADASASFWLEWHKEIRRQAEDHRLPGEVRARMRDRARRLLRRSHAAAERPRQFPRRWLRDRVRASLDAQLHAEGSRAAAAAGVSPERPVVALEMRHRPDTCVEALAWLLAEGYSVVRIGDGTVPLHHDDLIDLTASSGASRLLELFVLLTARFAVCESRDIQHVAYLTNTPSLLLNARDPFSAYPVRPDALFALSTAVDLDSGEAFAPHDMAGERYFRRRRQCGFRAAGPAAVLASVREMHEGVTHGWDESDGQRRFRSLVVEAGQDLGPRIPFVAEWGPDARFIGDGRLVRWQAESPQ